MRYMIRLDNRGYVPENAKRLLARVRELGVFDDVRDVRVASKHIELDVSTALPIEVIRLDILHSIGRVIGYTEIIDRELSKEERLRLGRELFNEERYWEAHEVLEGIWRHSNGVEKDLIQGLILVCAAFVHVQKAEYDIALSILRRALAKIEGNDIKAINGIDVVNIIDHINGMLSSNKIVRFFI